MKFTKNKPCLPDSEIRDQLIIYFLTPGDLWPNSRCISQVLDCLDHIHSTNVIHRDLKVEKTHLVLCWLFTNQKTNKQNNFVNKCLFIFIRPTGDFSGWCAFLLKKRRGQCVKVEFMGNLVSRLNLCEIYLAQLCFLVQK